MLAAATPASFGDPGTLRRDAASLRSENHSIRRCRRHRDHYCNALRGYELGRVVRERGAWVIFGGIHSTLYPEEALERGGAHAVVQGDGDIIWGQVLRDCAGGCPGAHLDSRRKGGARRLQESPLGPVAGRQLYVGLRADGAGVRETLLVLSVWRTDGQRPRQRGTQSVVEEIVELRRKGFRFIALADDNFYPVTLTDLELARRQKNVARLEQLEAIRAERFELMQIGSSLPGDLTFFTQITMEAAEDSAFLAAMKKAHIRGALVGIEAVTEEGLKAVYKDFNLSGANLVKQLRRFSEYGVDVLGSFIFGLPTDRPETSDATQALAQEAGITFAQFVMLTPFPGTVDFDKWGRRPKAPTYRLWTGSLTR